jgi:pilus assembly protein CpaB
MLVVAVILGGISAFAARNWIERQVNARPTAVVGTSVVVARTPLNFGDQIKNEHLKTIQWPKGSVPEGAFNKISDVIRKKGRPRVALGRIEPNEAILKIRVSGFGGRASLSTIMTENQRGVTIRVNDVTGVAGFLLPGDRVDVIMTRQEKKRPINDVLLQDIRVLGVGQISNEQRDKPVVVRAVTVEATPLETQKLVLAQQIGTRSLALRPVSDRTTPNLKTMRIADLLRKQAAGTPVPSKPISAPAKTVTKAINKTVTKAIKKTPSKKVRRRPSVTTVRIYRGFSGSNAKVPREPDVATQ